MNEVPKPADGYLVTFRGMIRKHWERQLQVRISVFTGWDWERPQKSIVRTVSMETVKRINILSEFGSSHDDTSCAGNYGAPWDAANTMFSLQRLIVRWFRHFKIQKRSQGNNVSHRRNKNVFKNDVIGLNLTYYLKHKILKFRNIALLCKPFS